MSEQRTEGVVRQDAAMWALVAEMEAAKTRIAGMVAENSMREHRGEALAYEEKVFADQAAMLDELARQLRGI